MRARAVTAAGSSTSMPQRRSTRARAVIASSGDSSIVAGSSGAPSRSSLPSTLGRSAKSYSTDRSCSSTFDRFSSTTRMARLPWANSRTPSVSNGQDSATL